MLNQPILPHPVASREEWLIARHAPLAEIEACKARMGWKFPWASSHGCDFNHDFHVSFTEAELARGRVRYNFEVIDAKQANDELPGLSAFYRDEDGQVFHSYSSCARGPEELIGTLMILDRAPLGRNEDAPKAASCCHAAS